MADQTDTIDNCNDYAISPFTPGKVKCKCVIWNSCPIYERVKQEFILQLSPETLTAVPDYIKQNFATLPNSDGAFLKTVDNFYLDTYLAEYDNLINVEYNPDQIKFSAINKEVVSGKGWANFLNKKDIDDKNYAVPPELKLKNFRFLNNYYLTSGRTHLAVTNGQVTSGNAIGSHQTFVVRGSIYDHGTTSFSAYNTRREINTFEDLGRLYHVQWGYKLIYAGNTKTLTTSTTTDANNKVTVTSDVGKLENDYKFLTPVILGIDAINDPIKLAADALSLQDTQGNYYNSEKVYIVEGINPGLHWGLTKRLMLSPGMGFSLTFIAQSTEPFRVADPKQKYKMLPEFDWLDPYQNNTTSDCAGYDGFGNFYQDQFETADAERKRIFNLAGQVYLMVQLPLDCRFPGRREKMFLVIAENIPPTIFRTEGYVAYCGKKTQTTPGSAADNSCSQATEQTQSSTTKVSYVWDYGAITVSTCDFISSSELLSRQNIKINFRVHLGKLIITFGGNEGQYWIISDTISKPPVENADVASANVETKTQPFQFTLSTVHIYGGNKKFAFNYTPIIYEEVPLFEMNQIVIPGPAKYDEIEFLLREKKSPEFNLGGKSYAYPYYQSNYATNYYEKVYDELPKYKSACNFSNAYNLDDEAKAKQEEDVAKSADEEPLARYAQYRKISPYTPNQDAAILLPQNGAFEPYCTELAVVPSNCFVKHQVEVIGLTPDGKPETKIETVLEDKKFNKQVKLKMRMKAGAIFMPDIDNFGQDWWLENGDTPILSNVRVHVYEKGCAWNKQPVDVSEYVLSFSDEWSETDYQKISHSGNISFLITDKDNTYDNFYQNFLYNLSDKTFYLQVSLWWENNLPKTADELANLDTDRVVFTGLCHGGQYTVENNKEVLNCTLYDYSKILQDQVFFNSPFYDRMADIFAVDEIIKMSGMRDGSDNGSEYEPGSFLKMCVDNYDKLKNNSFMDFIFHGEKVKVRNFVLPGSYDLLQSPILKFGDDSPLWGAIEKISLMSSKLAYFDRFGVFRYENMPFDNFLFRLQNNVQYNFSQIEQEALNNIYERAKKNCYVASHRDVIEYANQKASDIKQGKPVSATQMTCESNPYDAAMLLAIESYNYDRMVGDVKNEIKVISTTPNGELIVAGDVNPQSLYDPDSGGFIGYKKMFVQMDGIFGSEDTVKQMVQLYTKMYIPPLKISFKALGRNKLKVLDAITFQRLHRTTDEKSPFIITSIKNEVQADKNTWFQNIEALWLFSGKDITWGYTNTIGVGLNGSVSNL
jgi:hypothetical protein